MNRLIVLVLGLVVVGGGAFYVTNLIAENARLQSENSNLKGGGARPTPKSAAPTTPRAAAPGGTPRAISPGARQAMIDTLHEESGSEKKIWLRVDPSDPEAAGFSQAIADAFKEAGWDVQQLPNDGLNFKPGIFLLVGEEEWPPYAETANKALEAAGIEVTAARGYRSYYEQQSAEKPGWRGTKFLPDQTYVVLVGRKPEPKPES